MAPPSFRDDPLSTQDPHSFDERRPADWEPQDLRVGNRPRALLLTHAMIPGAGSEEGVGWNRVLNSSKYLDCWVICEGRMAAQKVAEYEAEHGPVPGVTFCFVDLTEREERMCESKLTYYYAYNRWHRRAFKLARQLHQQHQFDLIHQVNIIGYREPGYLYQLDAPFVWGPVGGVQNLPWRFVLGLGISGAVRETIRNVLNSLQFRFSRRPRQAAKKARVLLAANGENATGMEKLSGRKVVKQWETALPSLPECEARDFPADRSFHILWAGTAHAAKGLHLMLRALALLPTDIDWRMRVCGDRSKRTKLRKLAAELGIADRIEWFGWMTREQYYANYDWADAFAFTSLRDTSGNVMFESLSYGVPVIALDHQGAAEIIDDTCGIHVPVEDPAQVVRGIAKAIQRLATDPDLYERLSEGALSRAKGFTWKSLSEQMRGIYERVLDRQLVPRHVQPAEESEPVPVLPKSH